MIRTLTILFLFVSGIAYGQTVTKFSMLPRMWWGPSGNFGTGSHRYLDTFTNKYPSVLGAAWVVADGDFDPKNGQFDANLSVPGMQSDSTTIAITRPIHRFWNLGNGNQMVVVGDMEKLMQWRELWWYDQTGDNITGCVEVFIGSLEKIRGAVYDYRLPGTATPDYVLDASSVTGWKSITGISLAGQYICFRFDSTNFAMGANFSTFVPYGFEDPSGAVDDRIIPDFSGPLPRDTTRTVSKHAGVVIAHATPPYANYKLDTMTYWFGQGGYIGNFGSTSGMIDKYNGPWLGFAATANTYDLQPYGGPIYNTVDTVYTGPRWNYQVDKSPNRYLMEQTSYQSTEHIPINQLGDDPRYAASFERFAWQVIAGYAKLGPVLPNLTLGIGPTLVPERYANDPFPGRFAWNRVQYMPPYNENNMGFRDQSIPHSNWMSPEVFFRFHDTINVEWHKVFGSHPFTSQGLGAWGTDTYVQAEFLSRLWYMDKSHPLSDIINVHSTISTHVHAIDAGCDGNTNSQGVFPGQRNEAQRLQSLLDTLYYTMGVWRNSIVTEYAYSNNHNPDYFKPTGCDFISGLGAVQVRPTYRPDVSQGILAMQARAHFEKVEGNEGTWSYEQVDATDTLAGEFGYLYNNIDANNGVHNTFRNWFKAGYFINLQHNKWLEDYRFVRELSDSLNGNFASVYRNIYDRNNFILLTFWQAPGEAPSPRTYFLASDVTSVTRRTHLWPDWTFNGTTIATTVTSGSISYITRPEGDYSEFESDALAAELDAEGEENLPPVASAGTDQSITLPTSSVTVNGSSSSDPDGTISTYLWTKISGPAIYTIVSPNSATTDITGLVAGVYVFRLTVTDNDGATDTDDITITVNADPNIPPDANAGPDQTVVLAVVLFGAGSSDPDGTISSYQWTKVQGPDRYTILLPNSANTLVTNLDIGTYVFRLTITDNDGATDSDTVVITVGARARKQYKVIL